MCHTAAGYAQVVVKQAVWGAHRLCCVCSWWCEVQYRPCRRLRQRQGTPHVAAAALPHARVSGPGECGCTLPPAVAACGVANPRTCYRLGEVYRSVL